MTVVIEPNASNGVVRPHVTGDRIEFTYALKFSSTYKTGGDTTLKESLESLLKQVGGGTILWVQVAGVPGYLFNYNYETGKLQVFQSGKEDAVMNELAEAEYPAAIRNGKPRLLAIGV